MKLPVIFISHGSPMFAVEYGMTARILTAWGAALPIPPKSILIISPHWITQHPVVMSNPTPSTWHDFGGFPSALYRLQYPAIGNQALADQVECLLQSVGIHCTSDVHRPYDHGAWVPLMHLFPKADKPVVQLSLPVNFSLEQLFAMGEALNSLREQGVLIVASGSMTHNLNDFFDSPSQPQLYAAPKKYVGEFARWVEHKIMTQNYAELLNYRYLAPYAERAHPTEEHFSPLFFALGAANHDRATYLSKEIFYGLLAMDVIVFGSEIKPYA